MQAHIPVPRLIYVTGIFSKWEYLETEGYQISPHREKLKKTIHLSSISTELQQ